MIGYDSQVLPDDEPVPWYNKLYKAQSEWHCQKSAKSLIILLNGQTVGVWLDHLLVWRLNRNL